MRTTKYLRMAGLAVFAAALGMGATACKNGMGSEMSGKDLSKPDQDIIQIATGDNMEEVSTLVKLVKAADLVDTLKGPGPYTVFAPTNAAFEKLGKEKLDYLMMPEHKAELKDILLYHVAPGKIMAADVKTMSLTMADSKSVSVMLGTDGKVTLNQSATVIKPDIVAKNGVIHWIDGVLMAK